MLTKVNIYNKDITRLRDVIKVQKFTLQNLANLIEEADFGCKVYEDEIRAIVKTFKVADRTHIWRLESETGEYIEIDNSYYASITDVKDRILSLIC